jgi:glycosyltransferase involved in cell wall biosynthesis
VAVCSVDLVTRLCDSFDIDVFVDECSAAPGWPGVTVRPAHDFVWRHRQQPYSLVVYQLGNSAHHEYLWPYLFRFPGLVVLHDARLQHARAAMLLRERRPDDYRAEFAAAHPDLSADLAEIAIRGFDSPLYYSWPMTRLVVRASKMVAVHTPRLKEELEREHPEAQIATIRLGHGTPDVSAETGAAVRARFGIPPNAVLFGCFGGLTAEKRIPEVLRSFVWLRARVPSVHLILAGAPADAGQLRTQLRRLDLAGSTTVTGYIAREEDLDGCIAAVDVALTLRWPTAREISGPWLRALALGKPTVTMQLAHLADVPALDPRDWRPVGDAAVDGGTEAVPVAVAIDVLDEEHSLRLAMHRLAVDAPLRAALGDAARAYWASRHSIAGMVDDYRRLIERVITMPAPAACLRAPGLEDSPPAQAAGALPAHLINDGDGTLRMLLQPFGLEMPLR